MKNNEPKTISLSKSFSIFMIAGIQFYVVIKIIVPWLSKCLNTTEYIVWMFAGTFLLFIPIFSTAILLLKRDGYAMDFKTIKSALNLHKLSKKTIYDHNRFNNCMIIMLYHHSFTYEFFEDFYSRKSIQYFTHCSISFIWKWAMVCSFSACILFLQLCRGRNTMARIHFTKTVKF